MWHRTIALILGFLLIPALGFYCYAANEYKNGLDGGAAAGIIGTMVASAVFALLVLHTNWKAVCYRISYFLRCGAIFNVLFGACYLAGGIAVFIADLEGDILFGVSCLVVGVVAITQAVILWLYSNTEDVKKNTEKKKKMAKRVMMGI